MSGPLFNTQYGSNHYFHSDAQGSVADMTSSTGATELTFTYEPYGTVRASTGTTPPFNLVRFAGQYWDPSQFYHLRARQYDPVVGRFLSVDPLPNPADIPYVGSYVYVAARPTVAVDPTGQSLWDTIKEAVRNPLSSWQAGAPLVPGEIAHVVSEHRWGIAQTAVGLGCVLAPEACPFLEAAYSLAQTAVLVPEHGGFTVQFWADAGCGVAKNLFLSLAGRSVVFGPVGAHESLLARNAGRQVGNFLAAPSEWLSSPGCHIGK